MPTRKPVIVVDIPSNRVFRWNPPTDRNRKGRSYIRSLYADLFGYDTVYEWDRRFMSSGRGPLRELKTSFVFLAFLTVYTPAKHVLVELEIGTDEQYITTALDCAARVSYNVESIEEEVTCFSSRSSWAKVHDIVTDRHYFRDDRPVTRVYAVWYGKEVDVVNVLVGYGKAYGYLYPDPYIHYDMFSKNAYPRQTILQPLAKYRKPDISETK